MAEPPRATAVMKEYSKMADRYSLPKSLLLRHAAAGVSLWLIMTFLLYSLANLLVSQMAPDSTGMRIVVLIAPFLGILGHAIVLSNLLQLRSINYSMSGQFLTVEVDGHAHRIPRQHILRVQETRLKALRKERPDGLPDDSVYCDDGGWVRQKFCELTYGRAKRVLLVETMDERFALIPPGRSTRFIQRLQEESSPVEDLTETDDRAAMKRPVGIPVISTIIALSVLWNYLEVVGLTTTFPPLIIESETTRINLGITPLVLVGLLPAVLVLSLNLTAAFGLAHGAKWAHTLAIVLLVIGIAVGAAVFLIDLFHPIRAILVMTLNGAILYYLTRPHVKAYFER